MEIARAFAPHRAAPPLQLPEIDPPSAPKLISWAGGLTTGTHRATELNLASRWPDSGVHLTPESQECLFPTAGNMPPEHTKPVRRRGLDF